MSIHSLIKLSGNTCFVQGIVKVRKYGMSITLSVDLLWKGQDMSLLNPSAMCTPAIAEGLSSRMSAS